MKSELFYCSLCRIQSNKQPHNIVSCTSFTSQIYLLINLKFGTKFYLLSSTIFGLVFPKKKKRKRKTQKVSGQNQTNYLMFSYPSLLYKCLFSQSLICFVFPSTTVSMVSLTPPCPYHLHIPL